MTVGYVRGPVITTTTSNNKKIQKMMEKNGINLENNKFQMSQSICTKKKSEGKNT